MGIIESKVEKKINIAKNRCTGYCPKDRGNHIGENQ